MMGFKEYAWQLQKADSGLREKLAEELGIRPAVAQLLINRGVRSKEEGKRFLFPDLESLHSPELMKGLISARSKITKALEKGNKITIYGDYDVDGITSTVLLVSVLKKLGGHVSYYIPDRFTEGYGLNRRALEKIREEGTDLVVTVDCGISSLTETEYAKIIGMDIIITDHHLPPEQLPRCIMVNPAQVDCTYPWDKLAGVGVAFKLVQSILPREEWEQYLDLVAMGTIADVVPLLDENRILTKYGMEKLNSSCRPGINALKKISGFDDKVLTSERVPFSLAPRLNAAGRMGNAGQAVELLLTDSSAAALELAQTVDQYNRERQKIENSILQKAIEEIEEKNLEHQKVLVLDGEGWHPGVIGIIASRLVEIYSRPVVLISLDGEEGRGSARGIEGFNLIGTIRQCAELLTKYGGHEFAAGLTLPKKHVEELRKRINSLAEKELTSTILEPRLFLEAELDESEINLDLLDELKLLEPFGHGNPVPLFKGSSLEIEGFSYVGKQKNHLKLKLRGKQKLLEGIAFNMDNKKIPLAYRQVSVAFALEDNCWGEYRNPVLQLKDFHFNDFLHIEGINVIDRREVKRKEKYLQYLVNHGNTLIYINTLYQKERLSRILGQNEGIHYCHQGNIDGDVLGNIEHFVVYDLPLEAEKIFTLTKNIFRDIKNVNVHLIYSSEDLSVNRMFLKTILPQRSSLVKIYQVIKRVEEKGKVEIKKVIELLNEANHFSFTEYLFNHSLNIFQEINLLKPLSDEPKKYRLSSSEKVGDLSSSESFKENQRLWEEFEKFQDFMLQVDKDILGMLFLHYEGRLHNLDGILKEGGSGELGTY
ncbi:MAG: single-stranded-DNA-specific exonuclease RecJ [Firmicutes bacterium HGW-Firmicutes-13]|nr:MAG: single-stranded-DNA-specific exonuclease RecJ [Firmicutes bacterium HGW-Firmicutes-13]